MNQTATVITIPPAAPAQPAATAAQAPAPAKSGFWAKHEQALAGYKSQLDQVTAMRAQHEQLAARIVAATAASETDLAALLTQLGYDPAVGIAALKAAQAAV